MKIPFFGNKDPKAEFEKKLAKCRREAEEHPQDLRHITRIAELYLENGDTQNAIREYLNVAKGYQGARKNSIVVGIFRHIISLDPSQTDVYHLLADELMKDMLMGDAVEVMVKLATHYYNQDMHYEAAQAIKKIKTIDPNNKFYSTKVDKFFRDRKLDPEAIDKIGPKSKWTMVEDRSASGEIFIDETSQGAFNLEQALGESTLSGFISSLPQDEAGSTENLAPNRVFEQLRQFIDEDKKNDSPDFHYSLAMAYLRNTEYEKAHDEFLIALYGLDDKLDCYKKLIDCCLEIRWLDLAKDYIGKAQKIPKLAEREYLGFDYQMALIHKETGDRSKALKLFKKIFKRDKNFRNVSREIRELE